MYGPTGTSSERRSCEGLPCCQEFTSKHQKIRKTSFNSRATHCKAFHKARQISNKSAWSEIRISGSSWTDYTFRTEGISRSRSKALGLFALF